MKQRVAVLGGDLRQLYLSQFLRADGWETMTWGLDKVDAVYTVSLDRALEADIIVLPLPICRGEWLNLPLTDMKIQGAELRKRLQPEKIVFGGMAGSFPRILENEDRLEIFDYYDREEVQILNALPTAEGAILRAMEMTKHTLQGSSCLVVGYGRIGKVLSHRLRALGAEVTVSARRESDLAWIEVFGYRAIHTGRLSEQIEEYDVIFNTVPVTVLDAACLKGVKQSVILIELASLPGGIDRNAVKEYGLQMVEERGLPGVIAPETSAKVIRDSIYHILQEQGGRV